MTFNTMMSIAQEQQLMVKGAQRKEDNRVKSTTRHATLERFPGVPEDSPVFGALHQVNVNNPDRLNDLPAQARANFGERGFVRHDDDEGEFDFLSTPPPSGPIRSAVGILHHGVLSQSCNGTTQAGHTKTPDERAGDRIGKPLSSTITNSGRIPPSLADQVCLRKKNLFYCLKTVGKNATRGS